MNESSQVTVTVSLEFEKAQLPPFNDILLLGHKCPIGASGITKSLEYLTPNGYDVVQIEDPVVEAMVVNRSILKRLPVERIIAILRERVIPFMDDTEIMRVDFSVRIAFSGVVAT